jgi:methyl-accepting chemotaxis protein
MNNLSIKARLWVLVAVALATLIVIGQAGIYGMREGSTAVKELGWNRMPSIVALNYMVRGQLDIKVQNRNVLLLEHDAKAQEKAPKFLEARKKAYELMVKGYNIYEPLPQVPAEEGPWAELNKAWTDWVKGNSALDDIIVEIINTGDNPETLKELIKKYKAQISVNTQLSNVTVANMEKLLEINIQVGKDYYQNSSETMSRTSTIIYVLAFLTVIVVAIFAAMVIKSIVTPLGTMQQTMRDIQTNNDFTLRLHLDGKNELSQTASSFNVLVEKVQHSLQDILSGIREINAATGGLSTTASEVAASSNHQSESASAMAAAVEQMTVSISHVSSNASAASDLAKESGKASQEGAAIIGTTVEEINTVAGLVDETSGVISELGEQSQQISAIVQVIKEVADQTNLLALNAAIEAARAGEQGRGFAVVADEVRKLAERTTVSAVEIADMIGKIQHSTQEAVEKMDTVVKRAYSGKELATEAGSRVQGIESSVNEAVAAINEVSTSLLEQRAASENIAQNVESVSQMSEENSAAAGHTADAAQRLSQLASRMESSARQFKV